MGWTLEYLLGLDPEYYDALMEVAPAWLGVKVEPQAGETADDWTRVLADEDRHPDDRGQ